MPFAKTLPASNYEMRVRGHSTWTPVEVADVRRAIKIYYAHVNMALLDMREGDVIRAGDVEYRWGPAHKE
jgi:predicted enzyme related to lactoylglutathione lyase